MKKIRFIIFFFIFAFCVTLLACPVLAASDEENEITDVNCGSCLLVDMDTDTVLYSQDNSKRIYPASVTKILTALVVLEHVEAGDLSLDQTVKASDTFQEGLTSQSSRGGIQTGEKLSVESLLYMLLLPSNCDAANVLAEAASGSVEAFAEEMNQTAEKLGCTGSHFTNPSGLHNKNHYTTCDDLYLIGKAAYEYDTYRTIVGSKSYTIPATNLSDARKLNNTNALITDHSFSGYLYKYCTGGKTGSTYPAGYCLLSYAEKDGRQLCCVMMGCNWLINLDGSRLRLQFTESIRLYKWGFANFQMQTVVEKDSVQSSVPVTGSRNGNSVDLLAASDVTALLPKNISQDELQFQYDIPASISAPVSIGDVVGTLTVQLDDRVLGSTDLLAGDTCDAIPKILQHMQRLTPNSLLPLFAAAGAILLLLLLLIFYFCRRRRRHP